MERALVAFGSNLGEREANLRSALLVLRQHPLVALVDASPIYETDPVGGPPQGPFLNTAALFLTTMDVADFFAHLQATERSLGRQRTATGGPRTIDLDLLLFGDLVIDTPALKVPHPRLLERGFALKPACDVAGLMLHPSTQAPLAEHLRALGPLEGVRFFRAPGAWAVREMPHDRV
jgi:2-amino-4-hydroxy-6-hydroxymethyldihydropteridine diphosphokinase